MRPLFYDRKGNPLSLEKWAEAREDFRVARTEISEGLYVSTVYLGLNLGHFEGPPLIFETMVFAGGHPCECQRYPTEEAALAGHDQVVAELRAQIEVPTE